jgi:endoribonuclease Dicer
MLEAYIGAIFVDSGFNLTVVERFFEMHVLPFFRDMSTYDTFANRHPTVRIYTTDHNTNSFVLTSSHRPIFTAELPRTSGVLTIA